MCLEEVPNNYNYYSEKKFSPNLIALTLVCFGIGGWQVILTVALWIIIANDPTCDIQLQLINNYILKEAAIFTINIPCGQLWNTKLLYPRESGYPGW